MAPTVDTTSGATLFFAFVAALFCFVSYGTLGWSINTLTFSDAFSSADITMSVGLHHMCTEAVTTILINGEEMTDKNCVDTNCEGLVSEDCDHLTNAKIGGAVATATAGVLVIFALVLAFVDRMAWRSSVVVAYVINIALALAFAVAAFVAIAEFEKLLDNANDAGFDVEVGFSWVLMLIAGILACFCIVGSVMGLMASKGTSSATDKTNEDMKEDAL